MSTARTGRRPVKRIIALTVVVGISLVAGIATVWRLSEPDDGSAVPPMHAATLPSQEDPGEEVAADEDARHEPQATPAPAATPQPNGPTAWVSRGSPSRMVTVRPTSLDVIVDGRVSQRVAFGGASVTLAELDRALPADWLTIGDGVATLSATVVLTRGSTGIERSSTAGGLLMRLASVAGRATIVATSDGEGAITGIDVARGSDGRFGPGIATLYDDWRSFREWAATVDPGAGAPIELSALDNPAPQPRQVFAIGLNYLSHAAESGVDGSRGLVPPTFTKFPSSLSAPFAPVSLPSEKVDWEVELVAVIGRRAERVDAADAWSYVAGLAVGQDYSERRVKKISILCLDIVFRSAPAGRGPYSIRAPRCPVGAGCAGRSARAWRVRPD